jgi:hypothetical protein
LTDGEEKGLSGEIESADGKASMRAASFTMGMGAASRPLREEPLMLSTAPIRAYIMPGMNKANILAVSQTL